MLQRVAQMSDKPASDRVSPSRKNHKYICDDLGKQARAAVAMNLEQTRTRKQTQEQGYVVALRVVPADAGRPERSRGGRRRRRTRHTLRHVKLDWKKVDLKGRGRAWPALGVWIWGL